MGDGGMRILSRVLLVSALLQGVAAYSAGAAAVTDDRETFFEIRIRPILVARCAKCHGQSKVNNGVRIDRRESLIRGGDSGPAIVPGRPDQSLLIRALRQSDDLKMPPDGKLPEAVISDFERWIRDGAVWPNQASAASKNAGEAPPIARPHWAFQPVVKVTPPVDSTHRSENAVDCFISQRLRSLGIEPVKPAPKHVLLRRAYFDLIGLPPSPEDLRAFLKDDSPSAFASVVERLLASPQYGERWGRYWMDVARYADTAGDNADYPVPEAHLYRDYIIDSFNADKPYDQFLREQLAGDLLAMGKTGPQYAEQVTATGFLALSRRYATAPYELWHLTLEDTIDTVGRACLGMTVRCARCHDHKFDPITTADYYALYGVFASTQFPYAGSEELVSMKFGRRSFAPLVPQAAAAPRLVAYTREIQGDRAEIAKLRSAHSRKPLAASRLKSLEGRLFVLERRGSPEALPVAYAVSEGTIADANIQLHGEPGQPGPKVARGAPRFLPDLQGVPPAANESGRLQLAEWIASPRNPLTARVMVNRVWQHHFGRGIVATPSNFGTRGSPPSHPELLDWLTASFVEHGWSLKWLHRVIMNSRTYQLDSASDRRNEVVDETNRWYWRFERQRLDAEAIRDAMLAVAGVLDRARPSEHPFPAIANWTWTQHFPFKAAYESNHRSVYLMTQRLHRHPFLGLFDGPDTNTTTDVRSSSTVPLQALFLMNSKFMRDTAETFARRSCAEATATPERICRMEELAYGRPPTQGEIERATTYLTQFRTLASSAGLNPTQADTEAWLSYARVILTANEFFYID
jgi:cytochrome c553